uniref:ORF1/1 n=1 Tax=Torque teno sus virus 1a TaxID=687386 RepID=A0A385FPQ0_9VIRU|nr:ORF1/1 [Torque teno sus virus 1a]
MRFRRRRFGRRRRYYRKRRGGWRRRYGRRWRRTAWRRRRFGGMYQPPCGIQDPGTSNPTYPVRMGGAVTHPKYAGQGGGYTTQIGHQGITAASLRAISAAPPRTYSQSAFLQEPKEEKEGEETEETTSESSITSAESSSEGDGSSENEERRERRRRNKRRLRIFLQRLADRSLDHKRRRFSE